MSPKMEEDLTDRPPAHIYPDDPRSLTEEYEKDPRYIKVDAKIGACWMCQLGRCIQWQRQTKHVNFIQHAFISPE